MATIRQKKLAKAIIENSVKDKPLPTGQVLKNVGYGTGLQTQPKRVLESEGVKEELKAQGFTEENAMQVVKDIMLNEKADNSSRLKATDQVFKVKGSYAPEKRENINININQEAKDLANKAIDTYLDK